MEERLEIDCPHCGETIGVFAGLSDAGVERVEDCQVCCRSIDVRIELGPDGELRASGVPA